MGTRLPAMSKPVARTVYIVDDDASLRRSLKNLLSSVGLRVETFSSAEEFLAKCSADAAACLVVDVRLTGMSGLDLLRELKAAGSALRSIVLTGHGDVEAREQARALGATAFFTKPFRAPELLDAIKIATDRDSTMRPAAAHGLPTRSAPALGRARAVRALLDDVPKQRLLTLVGPGGIGKTTVAIEVAEEILATGVESCRFLDLSALPPERAVTGVVLSSIGARTDASDLRAELQDAIGSRRMLFVLDCCERVTREAAGIADMLVEAAANVIVLATSREPLRAKHERVHRLDPLELPPRGQPLSAEQALGFASIELFVQRATRAGPFRLTDADAPALAALCRRLDGIPLAIELAASRVLSVGLEALAAGVDEVLLSPEQREMPSSRHQTIRATLDWSYDLLSDPSRTVLQRLSMFRASFSLSDALGLSSDDTLDSETVQEQVVELVSKSLLVAEFGPSTVEYRLLDLTREYAFEKLGVSGELATIRSQHARLCKGIFDRSEIEWASLSRDAWLLRYGRMLDDARAALDWAFGPRGELSVACPLAATAYKVAAHCSRNVEFKRYAMIALRRVGELTPDDPSLELRLNLATGDTGGDEAAQQGAHQRIMALVARMGNPGDRAMALHIAWSTAFGAADYRAALRLVTEYGAAIGHSPNVDDAIDHERMLAMSFHYAGDHPRARHFADSVLARVAANPGARWHPLVIAPPVSMRVVLARTNWLEGLADDAVQLSHEALEIATASGHAVARAFVLALASCPLAFWSRGAPEAQTPVDELIEHCRKHQLGYWRSWGRCYAAAVGASYAPATDADVFDTMQLDTLGTLVSDLASPSTVARAEGGLVGWCAAEVLRAKGERALRAGGLAASDEAEEAFLRAGALSRAQGALAWELRAATSLAHLWHRRGRLDTARDLLEGVLSRFRQGSETLDVRSARAMTCALGAHPGRAT
jgi:predicted ATPase/ActR/RegA family two-component response regulator